MEDSDELDTVFTLAHREECEGMSVRTRHSKTVAPIDFIFLRNKCYARGSVLL